MIVNVHTFNALTDEPLDGVYAKTANLHTDAGRAWLLRYIEWCCSNGYFCGICHPLADVEFTLNEAVGQQLHGGTDG